VPAQTTNGKAFEAAVAGALQSRFAELNKSAEIDIDSVYSFADSCLAAIERANPSAHLAFLEAASAAARQFILFEPRFLEADGAIRISLQTDSAGQLGDVRDVVVSGSYNGRPHRVGISCKNNHSDLKHQRISARIDIGHDWFGSRSSPHYMAEAGKIFAEILAKKTAGISTWAELGPLKNSYYSRAIHLLAHELKLQLAKPDGPARFITYLIGNHDFYKFIKLDQRSYVMIQAFNLHGTLGKPAAKLAPPINIARVPTATSLMKITANEPTNLAICLEGGWQIKLRVHNASSKIEPSLKLSSSAIGSPAELFTIYPSY